MTSGGKGVFGTVTTAALLAVIVSAAGAQTNTSNALPLTDYRRLIRAYRENVVKPAPNAAAVRDRLKTVRFVTLPDGSRVAVNNSADGDRLSRRLKTGEMGRRERLTLATRAVTLEHLVSETKQSASVLQGDARGAAARILSAPEFARARQPKREDSWFDKARKSLFDFIERTISKIFSWFRPKSSVDPTLLGNLAQFIQYVLFFALAIGAVIGVYFLARLVMERNPQWRNRRGKTGPGDLDLAEIEMHDPLSAAQTLADSGDYRGAVRLVYIASLRRLAGAGLLTMARDRTNWEYQRAVRARSQEAYGTLLPATRLFDRVWYGRMPATRDEYEAAVAVHHALPDSPAPAGTPP